MQAALDVPQLRLHTQYFVLVQPEIEFVGSFETNCANLFLSHTMLHENSCVNRTLVAKVQSSRRLHPKNFQRNALDARYSGATADKFDGVDRDGRISGLEAGHGGCDICEY